MDRRDIRLVALLMAKAVSTDAAPEADALVAKSWVLMDRIVTGRRAEPRRAGAPNGYGDLPPARVGGRLDLAL